MSLLIDEIPKFSLDEAVGLVRDLYGITGAASSLPSDRDQNFLLEDEDGRSFVLKIANSATQRTLLDAQNEAMERVARYPAALRCPAVCPTVSGEKISTINGAGNKNHFVRMLTYSPGVLIGELQPHTPELRRSLGEFFGHLDRALEGFDHPGVHRHIEWDLAHGPETVRRYLPHLTGFTARSMVEKHLVRYEENVVGQLQSLRRSVIHSDGNDYNVLAEDPGTGVHVVTGVIDFGDMVKTQTVFEVAIATTYAMLDKSDPIAAATDVVGGYHAVNSLTHTEQDVLFDLLTMRLCMSVCIAAYQIRQNPANEYLLISQRPAWEALGQLAAVERDTARDAFHDACGDQR